MRRLVRNGVAALAFGGLVWSSADATGLGPAVAPVPVIVELFTSEGCSSCPPADQLLMTLMGEQPVPGALVIGLSEHVDYWNQLGWKDPFSSAAFSQRQSDYAARLGTNDVYTPQMVVDGVRAFVGSDRSAALGAIAQAAATPKAVVDLKWTGPSSRTLSISLEPSASTADATLLLAIVEDGLESSVSRGENQGRRLSHGAVTRRLLTIGKADHAGAFHGTSAVAIESSWKASAVRVVVLAQRRGGTALVAAGSVGLS